MGMFRGKFIPMVCTVLVANFFTGTTGPIGTARQADRVLHNIIKVLEVCESNIRIAKEFKCNPPSIPFGFCNITCIGLTMVGHQTIGIGYMALLQGATRQNGFFKPPVLWADRDVGQIICL